LKLSTNSESFWLTELPALECLTMLVQISQEIVALSQVVFIDLVLAGDNAIVIGLAAAGLPLEQRGRAILVGIAAATVLRITFALAATQLLQVVGLALVGGILLLWVSWKMVGELQTSSERNENSSENVGGLDINTDGTISESTPQKSFRQAATQIVVADVSMSLDNVLAVAGAAREHTTALVFGLALSIALMGIAASYIARFLNSYRWVAYGGVLLILYVAVEMIYRGVQKIWPFVLEAA
jgi:YjbE family integral membrane protein